jgi:hypothetical protein
VRSDDCTSATLTVTPAGGIDAIVGTVVDEGGETGGVSTPYVLGLG